MLHTFEIELSRNLTGEERGRISFADESPGSMAGMTPKADGSPWLTCGIDRPLDILNRGLRASALHKTGLLDP